MTFNSIGLILVKTWAWTDIKNLLLKSSTCWAFLHINRYIKHSCTWHTVYDISVKILQNHLSCLCFFKTKIFDKFTNSTNWTWKCCTYLYRIAIRQLNIPITAVQNLMFFLYFVYLGYSIYRWVPYLDKISDW